MEKKKHYEIIERYCSHLDENVIMTYKHGNTDRLICLSKERCRHIHPNGCERAETNTAK